MQKKIKTKCKNDKIIMLYINYKYSNQIGLNLIADAEEILEGIIQLTVPKNKL